MKRDMDLCRKILLSVEAREGTVGPDEVSIEGYTEGQIGYHAKLLADQGLLEGRDITGVGGSTHRYAPRLCLLFIHPRASNWISLQSAGIMPA